MFEIVIFALNVRNMFIKNEIKWFFPNRFILHKLWYSWYKLPHWMCPPSHTWIIWKRSMSDSSACWKSTIDTVSVISRIFHNFWLPQSPDMTPVDFWWWSNLNRLVYAPGKPRTITNLKARILRTAETISTHDLQQELDSLFV